MRNAIVVGAALIVAIAGVLEAQAPVRIDFDSLPVGTRVDTQYLHLGLRVLGPAGIDTVPGGTKGNQVLVGVFPMAMAMGVVTHVVLPGSLSLGFTRPQAIVALMVVGRSRIQGKLWGVVDAYDLSGKLLKRDGPRLLDGPAGSGNFSVLLPAAAISALRVAVVDSTSDGPQPAVAMIDDLVFSSQLEHAVADLIKMDLSVALRTLADSGFEHTIQGGSKDPSKRWIVVGQSTPAGELRPPGTIVTVRIAEVPPPPPLDNPIPDLGKRSVVAATKLLTDLGFQLGEVRGAPQDSLRFAFVSGQTIPPGQRRPRGTRVGVDVAIRGVTPVPPPPPSWPKQLLVAALMIVGATWVWSGLRWRVRTVVHTGIETMQTHLTQSEAVDWEVRFTVHRDDGGQRLRENL